MFLTKDQILAADDLAKEPVKTPEWGGDVCVRTLMGDEAEELFSDAAKKSKGTDNVFLIRVVAACLCDKKGERLFDIADIVKLAKKGWPPLRRVFDAACKLNGIGEDEDIAGNSTGTPDDGSGSS